MDALLGVEVKRLDEDNGKEITTKPILDTDEADTGTIHKTMESRMAEGAGRNEVNEGEIDAGGSGDDGDDEDDRMLSEEDIETCKTYVIENLSEMVKEIKALPFEERYNEQGHAHQSIEHSFFDFNNAYRLMDFLRLEEVLAFRRAVAELMVATGYYEICCEYLIRTLHYTTNEYFQNEADDAKLFCDIYLSQVVLHNFTDASETLCTALAKFPGYVDACRAFLDFFEEEHKGFENLPPPVS